MKKKSGFCFGEFLFIFLFCVVNKAAMAEGELGLEASGNTRAETNDAEPVKSAGPSLLRKSEAIVDKELAGQKKPGCSEVTDGFCEKLWAKESSFNGERGNTSLADGKFYLGKSPQKAMAMIRKIDAQALLDAEPRLPEDLRAALSKQGLLKEYKDILSLESDDRRWKRKLADIEQKISNVMQEVAESRTEKRMGKKPDESMLEGAKEYNQDIMDLRNEILEAKYAQSENWKRVERVYARAKVKILAQIDKLPLAEKEREQLRSKVEAIELQMPYPDVRKWPGLTIDGGSDCSTTDLNAFYLSTNNKFTVCAGLFNGIQSESGLFMVVAHELSHSIDPNNCIRDHHKENSPFMKVQDKLIEKNGKAFSCEKWAEIKKDLIAKAAQSKPQKHLWSGLSDCLRNGVKLEDFDQDILKKLSLSISKREMGDMADEQKLTALTADTMLHKDQLVANNDFLNPDRYNGRRYGGFSMAPHLQADLYWFTQEYQCQLAETNKNELSAGKKAELLEAAGNQILKLGAYLNFEQFNGCTTECRDLQEYNYSSQTGEQFADWMAFNALKEEIQEEKSIEMRRLKTGAAVSLFCGNPIDRFSHHSDLNRAQKKFSMMPHPENRMRRLSLYGEKMRAVVECEKDQSLAQSPADCTVDGTQGKAE